MQVHILWVGENDLHQAERVRWPGLLPHHQVEGFYSLQNLRAHFTVSYKFAFGSDDLKVVFGDIRRVFLNVGDNFIPLNAGRDLPIRSENNVVDLFLENW